MGIGDLLSGLTTAAGGIQTGLANRKALEAEARKQLLAQQLEQAKFGMASANIQSEIQRRADQTRIDEDKLRQVKEHPDQWQINVAPDGTMQYIPKKPPEQQPGTPRKSGVVIGGKVKPPAPIQHFTTDAQGNIVVASIPKGGGAITTTAVPGAAKPTSAPERVAGNQYPVVTDAVQRLDRIS